MPINPIIRWVGGKRKLLDSILNFIPCYEGSYYEPFVGGGAVLLTQMNSTKQYANDANHELVNFYKQVQDDHQSLIDFVLHMKCDEATYYEVRSWDHDQDFMERRSKLERAARFFYLNQLSFQGLWRVNGKTGCNNSPWGHKKNPLNVNAEAIEAFSRLIKNVSYTSCDFQDAINNVDRCDFVYFDPPYIPTSSTSSFTGYTKKGFENCHERLHDTCVDLTRKGIKFLLSNSDSERSRELYKDFDVLTVNVTRVVSAKKSSRGKTTEILVKNY